MSDPLRDRVIVAVGEHYLIEDELGRGGMAVVYRALDLRLNRHVAIKALPPELAFNPLVRERFGREAQTAAQLSHPHIVPIYDVNERDGVPYLVMALIVGENLGAHLHRQPRPPLDEVRRILHEVADALAYAHARGVVHRDIKPDNILIERGTGRAVVTDFGIAHAAQGDTRLTATGVAVGTPTYMSPEQAVAERDVDGRSDLYSLGVVGYQMLTGAPPFAAGNTMALMMKHIHERPQSVGARRPDTPAGLAAAVDRALMKEPAARWKSAAEFRDVLDAPPPGHPLARPLPVRGPVAVSAPAPPPDGGERRPRRGKGRDEEDVTRPVEERIVAFRRNLATSGGTVAMLAAINVATMWDSAHPFYWFVFPAIGLAYGVAKRAASLWADGVGVLDVFGRSAKLAGPPGALPRPPLPADPFLAAIPIDVREGRHGAAIRRAAEDRAAILALVAGLPAPDREMIPDVEGTARGLADRVAAIAPLLHGLETEVPDGTLGDVARRLAAASAGARTEASERRVALLQRQEASVRELVARRDTLAAKLESAGLALQNLRLDLLKLRSSGIGAALGDVNSATREARAVARDIGYVLDAAAEVKGL
ncbi:MAG: hypothetical protein NVS1B4_03330 [Gemmatimonadaceae bacterium]